MRELKALKDPAIKTLVEKSIDQGGRFELGGAHGKVFCPWHKTAKCANISGFVTVAKSPSDHRTVKNTRSNLRKCGFTV
jgi:hypothetical protein